jgi:branched-chain amino acid transport system permease protein
MLLYARQMGYFTQQLINGITLGSIYGLIAIGYTMVYGIVQLINFAHGEIYMIGAFASLTGFALLALAGPLPAVAAILLVLVFSVMVTGAYGLAVERIAYRRLRRSTRLAPLISAIGVSIFLQNYVQLTEGARIKTLPPVISGALSLGTDAAGFTVTLSYLQMLVIGLTFALMAVFTYIIANTELGRAQRATSQDKTMTALLGIDVDRTIALTFVIGAGLAAVAGLMAAVFYGVIDFTLGFLAGIKAFTAAVLGGIGSLPGAMLGGLLLGIIETLWSAYLSAEYRDVASFAILIAVLIVRPSGLLGQPEIEKV